MAKLTNIDFRISMLLRPQTFDSKDSKDSIETIFRKERLLMELLG